MQTQTQHPAEWKNYQKILFRVFFIYFLLQAFPADWKYYLHLLQINWSESSFRDIFNISKYTPQFISGTYRAGDWGIGTFADWLFIFVVALAGAVIWSFTDQKSKNYNKLYYWLRVLVRYRLAIAVIAYGLLKLFALQAPYPSISSLNTPYGDFSAWKLFSLSLGIVPGYQSFLGAVEILAGLLLLNRKTAPIGATIVIFFTGNVFMSNLAYEGGEVVYSFYLVTLALFLVAYDLERIVNLLILSKPTFPVVHPVSLNPQQKTARYVLKSIFIFVFVVINGVSVYRAAADGGYHFPRQAGVKGLAGLYTVDTFRINGQTLPQSLSDTLRWQNVVFEKWASLSIKINRRYVLTSHPVEAVPAKDELPGFEREGTVGRKYYNYQADTLSHQLLLNDQSGKTTKDQLEYRLQPDSSLVLTGLVDGNRIEAVLRKDDKQYLLKATQSGRRKSLKL